MVDCKLKELPSLRGNYNNTFETNLKKSKHKKNSLTLKAKEFWDLAVLLKIQIYLVEVNLRKSLTLKKLMSFLEGESLIFRKTVETTLNLLWSFQFIVSPFLANLYPIARHWLNEAGAPVLSLSKLFISNVFSIIISFKIWIGKVLQCSFEGIELPLHRCSEFLQHEYHSQINREWTS